MAAPVRGELNRLQTTLAWRGFVDIKNKAEKQGISLKPETIQALEFLEGSIQRREAMRHARSIYGIIAFSWSNHQ